VLLPAIGSVLTSGGWTPGYLGSLNSPGWLALSLIATAGLLSDRGLRPGVERLGRSTTLLAVVSAFLIGVITMPPLGADLDEAVGSGPTGILLLGLGVALFVAACVRAGLPDARNRGRVTAAAIALHLALACGFVLVDGGTWIGDLREQLDVTLPLTLLVCAVAVGLRVATVFGSPRLLRR
jgi:hypothetical protein